MRLSAVEMRALLDATTFYLAAPFAEACGDGLSPEEEDAATTARTILVMASECLDPSPPAGAVDVCFTADEMQVLRRAASACLEVGVAPEGLPAAYAALAQVVPERRSLR